MNFKEYLRQSLNEQVERDEEENPYVFTPGMVPGYWDPDEGYKPGYPPNFTPEIGIPEYEQWQLGYLYYPSYYWEDWDVNTGHDWDGDGINDYIYIDPETGDMVVISGRSGEQLYNTTNPNNLPDVPLSLPQFGPDGSKFNPFVITEWPPTWEDPITGTEYEWNPDTGQWEVVYIETGGDDDPDSPWNDPNSPEVRSKLWWQYMEWLLGRDLNGDGYYPRGPVPPGGIVPEYMPDLSVNPNFDPAKIPQQIDSTIA